ncbi:stage IV sporulation protein FB [Clostridium tepidiprofundi DSM 19306]|uniref:Stage IV sporulation protein FB n=1 Tax=Clostridium tepidiprofundi DSM 19306 TaxID=1121338 RepID=A0A151B3L4_9CLOT|nr:M50 family metallopeptidase [Clostridium tepidiprofundi]KYH34486.1 stage IV sporulation protein FB [Clostridium tepidiprofundi DSM 19306]
MVVIGFKGELAPAFIFALVHEMSHYLTAKKLGYTGLDMNILPIGTALYIKDLDEASAMEDIIISISGPLTNFILAFIFYFLWVKLNKSVFYCFYFTNFALGVFNLIPAYPLDGGRILRDILWKKYIFKTANKITTHVSIMLGILLMLFYFILFLRGKPNFNLGVIAVFIVIISVKEKERIAYLIMGDIIKKRYKFLKRGYIENRSISIYYKKDLLTAVGLVDKNKYNVFLVLDDSMDVVDILYEEELINALKEYGNMSINDFLNKK